MPHKAKALLIRCMDFRFEEAIEKYLKEHDLLNKIDIVALAGAGKNIADPDDPHDEDTILHQLDLSEKLHDIHTVIIMNHTDCGGYGGRKAFASDEAEHEKHAADLKKARKIILKSHPKLDVRLVLAKISPAEEIDFEELK